MERKSEVGGKLDGAIREMASILRRHRLDFAQSAYVLRRARASVGVQVEREKKRLPKNLTDGERDAFFVAVEAGGNVQHLLLFRLTYTTGLRVSEMVAVKRADVDLASCSIRVNEGKGGKDRRVLFPDALLLPLRLYLDGLPAEQVYLFETRRRQKMTARWVQTLAAKYGDAAGIDGMHPHRLRHTLLTNLSRAGLTDTQIQQVSGHSSKRALAVYQSLALTDVAEGYQEAMRQHDVRSAVKRQSGRQTV